MSQSEEAEVAKLGEKELPQSRVLDHLGLVAGMFEELEIGDRIDEQIAQDLDEREVSIGQAVKAVVLNGFGFVAHVQKSCTRTRAEMNADVIRFRLIANSQIAT